MAITQKEIERVSGPYRSKKFQFNKLAAIESRGFVFASAVSYILKKPFILLRKKNKLPAEVHSIDFKLEYGTATMEIHKDAVNQDDSVLLIDDLIATGGTAEAAANLIEMSKGKVAGYSVANRVNTADITLQVSSQFINFNRINGRRSNVNSFHREHPQDHGMEYSHETLQDIWWGKKV